MKIVADENIPLLSHYFADCDELLLKSGRDIQRADLLDADILLIRSVTKVNQSLLENTSVKFVGSATSGADHLDTDWLDANNIKWSVAAGCNAVAVEEYVVCVIAALQNMNFLLDKKIRAAVVGVGRIGQLVVDKLKMFRFDVVLCDPLRTDISSIPLSELTDLDFISFHTPLTKTGIYPTYQLVQKEFFQKQKKNCILLNAGRGDVFAFDSLKKYGKNLRWCLDVWENEPVIDGDVLNEVVIATPHIAGYSLQSKYRGIEMIYEAAVQQKIIPKHSADKIQFPTKKLRIDFAKTWRDAVLSVFNPLTVTAEMKQKHTEGAAGFDLLRKQYADRYEFAFVELEENYLSEFDKLFLKNVGFS